MRDAESRGQRHGDGRKTQPLDLPEISRRNLLLSAAALGGLAAIGVDFAPPAHAAHTVQYSQPFALGSHGRHASAGHMATDYSYVGIGGLAIPAIADGVVKRKGDNTTDLGYRIELYHADGVYSGYCHMRAASTLNVGDEVKRGDTLGFVGGTRGPGLFYAEHLHLAMSASANKTLEGSGGYASCFDAWAYINARLTAPTNNSAPFPIRKKDEVATGFLQTPSGSIYMVDSSTGKVRGLSYTEWSAYSAQGYGFATASQASVDLLIASNGTAVLTP